MIITISIRKRQNVFKSILLVLIFSLSGQLYCQKKIIGRYTSLMPNQEHYNYFDFNKNGIFEYHSGASLGKSEFGKGHYKIKNDSLILNYDLTELNEESYFKAKKYSNSKDSILVNLNIYNIEKEPLFNIIVYSYPDYQSTESSKEGFASLKLAKGSYQDKVEFHIDGEFWARQIIYLDSDTNYNIDVFMNKSVIQSFGHPKAIKNKIVKFKIIESTKKYFILKHNNRTLKLIKLLE